MARSILLTGVVAPVGGKPFPVLIALTEAFTAPNSYRVPLRGCFALGKAEGNASSERADIQVVLRDVASEMALWQLVEMPRESRLDEGAQREKRVLGSNVP